MTDAERFKLDDLDFSILDELQEDGRRSFRDIGRGLGVTAATVRSRVQQLQSAELVEIVAVPNPWKLGLGFFANVALSIEPQHVNEAAAILAQREDTHYLGIAVTG